MHRLNLENSTYRMEHTEEYLQHIFDKKHLDNPELYEEVSIHRAYSAFAQKRKLIICGKKIGDADALRIGKHAESDGFTEHRKSQFSKLGQVVVVTDNKGSKLRSLAGLTEKIHEEFPTTTKIVLGGSLFAIVTKIIDIILMASKTIGIPFI